MIRIWVEIDINDVEKHMLLVDDQLGFCPGCREIAIKLENLEKCPGCGREFKYISAREAAGDKSFDMVVRVKNKFPDMTFIDYNDYKRLASKNKTERLFDSI